MATLSTVEEFKDSVQESASSASTVGEYYDAVLNATDVDGDSFYRQRYVSAASRAELIAKLSEDTDIINELDIFWDASNGDSKFEPERDVPADATEYTAIPFGRICGSCGGPQVMLAFIGNGAVLKAVIADMS